MFCSESCCPSKKYGVIISIERDTNLKIHAAKQLGTPVCVATALSTTGSIGDTLKFRCQLISSPPWPLDLEFCTLDASDGKVSIK